MLSEDLEAMVAFTRARLDEDKQRAEATGEGRIAWLTYLDDDGQMHYTTVAAGGTEAGTADDSWVTDGKELPAPARVLVFYDQASALREIEARQRVIDRCASAEISDDGDMGAVLLAEAILVDLAAPYAGHADYQQRWTP